MIEAPAEVIRAEGGQVRIRLSERQGGCGRCDEPGGCRSMRITDTFGAPRQEFSLPDSSGLVPGERVRITIPDGAPLRAALLSYGLGAVLTLTGAALGHGVVSVAAQDAGAAAGAVAGLALAIAINRLLARSRRWRGRLGMTLVRETDACTHRT
jgi:sigma-E factor negative regulatory protein RseC